MSIYRDELMEIYKNPAHRGSLKDFSASSSQKNPMCGDEVHLQLKIKDGVIKDAKFEGSACSVSVISSDVLLDFIGEKTIEEVKEISKEDLLKMLDLNLSTSRVKCATLVLSALQEAINDYETKSKK